MRAAILAVGSELLGTDRLDTNSLRLTECLERHGVELVTKQVIGDDVAEIARAVGALAERCELLLITGGLGPTSDDLTRDAVARATQCELHEEPAIIEHIRHLFRSFGREMPESNRKQALVPEGALILDNPRGTAPGLRLEYAGAHLFLFPGVPRELEGMITRDLDPWLAASSSELPKHRLTLRVACLPESEVEQLLAPVYAEFGPIGLLASPGDIRVRLDCPDAERLAAMNQAVRDRLGRAVYGEGDEGLEAVVGRQLIRRQLTIATAESCTGGWIAQRLTSVAGSSAYFAGSIIAYADRVKSEQLGVEEELIDRDGAVSQEVVEAMASGARERLGTDLAVAVSGVAGPGGGSEQKPVGTVDLALAQAGSDIYYRRFQFPGDRRMVRLLTTQWALDTVRRALDGVAPTEIAEHR